LLRLKRNGKLQLAAATKQPDGQITKSLSRPLRKKIALNALGKSVV